MASVLRLPDHGRLLVCTDLQGNLRDFNRMVELFHELRAETQGNAHLLFTGDLIHGPHIPVEQWPDFLGEYYVDESGAVVDGFIALRTKFPGHVHAILGNHEHGHIGGPHTAKFAPDEVALLEERLGRSGTRKLQDAFKTFYLVAVAPCGVVFTHGAPAAELDSIQDIESADLSGEGWESPLDIFQEPVIGPILWARSASREAAQRFLRALGGKIAIFGHDVIPEGYECIGDEQMIVSTSFGVADAWKVYLELDLAAAYGSVKELREGYEILPLYPRDA